VRVRVVWAKAFGGASADGGAAVAVNAAVEVTATGFYSWQVGTLPAHSPTETRPRTSSSSSCRRELIPRRVWYEEPHMATVLTGDEVHDVEAEARPGTLLLTPGALQEVTGWDLKPEGLCRADVCVPTRSRADVQVDERVDLRVVAELLGRPLAIDDDTAVAALGESAATRTAQLASGRVDDLVLHDLDGKPFSWSSLGRKKKLLVTWASW
jgi:hypothetical protein